MTEGFLKDMLKYLPAQVVPGLVGLVSIPVVTRIFPPGEYGYYSLTAATVMVLSTFFGWLPISVIRYYPVYERQGRLTAFNSTVIQLAILTLAGLAILYYGSLLALRTRMSAGLWHLLMLGGLLFIATGMFNLLQYFLRCRRRVGRFSAFAVWHSAAGFGLGIAMVVYLGFGIEGLLLGTILSVAVALPLLWRQAVGGQGTVRLTARMDLPAARAALAYGTPLVAGNLAAWILALSDRYIIGLFRDSSEVGVYALSYNLADKSLMLLLTLFTMSAGPIGMRIWENQGQQQSKRFVTDVVRLYLITAVPLVVGLSVLSRLVVGVMAGAQYASGYRIMPYVFCGVLLLGIEQQYQWGLLFNKRTGLITVATIVAGVLNVVLNLLFVPRYGYFAAAITTLVSYAVHLTVTVRLSRRVFVWSFPIRSLVNVAVASVIMGGAVYAVGYAIALSPAGVLLVCAGAGAASYALVLLLLGEFSSQELTMVRQAIHRTISILRRVRRTPAAVDKSRAEEIG